MKRSFVAKPKNDLHPVEVARVAKTPTDASSMIRNGEPTETASAKSAKLIVQICVVHGGYTQVQAPVAVCPRYQGLPLAGPAKAFDSLLDSWLTRAVELGMIGSGLGQLFPVNLQARHQEGRINVEHLLIVGMGEPGRFATGDLRYLMSNVIVATKSLARSHLSTMLIGTRRNELRIESAVRGTLTGILDGIERFKVIVDSITTQRKEYRSLSEQPLLISIVESDRTRCDEIYRAFAAAVSENAFTDVEFHITGVESEKLDAVTEKSASDTDPYLPVTLLRVTRNSDARPATEPTLTQGATEVFKYSALSDAAAITVREVEVNSYLVDELPKRMTGVLTLNEREEVGEFFTNYLIPDEFRGMTDGSDYLTLVVDETTSVFPWEMAAHKEMAKQRGDSTTSFLGTSTCVSRQFFSLLSPPPSSLPPLNKTLNVLVIADPAAGDYTLAKARNEGIAVVQMLKNAQEAWKGECDFKVTVRLGSSRMEEDPAIAQLRELTPLVVSAKSCDPLELAILIVNNHYDVIHFAGHGEFNLNTGRAGWIFDQNCLLSAQEIFRVRQVPRLVFANACFSAVTSDLTDQRQLVGLAQAFFKRGIPNYIGTGWEVDDACAELFARWFYTRALGLKAPHDSTVVIGEAPPATIGEALRIARETALRHDPMSSTWGAYQHYGKPGDKLMAFRNREETLREE